MEKLLTRWDNVDYPIEVKIDDFSLGGNLCIPPDAKGLVVFVHGSGSSRHSPRNKYVARVLNSGGLATLLFDLLTATEETFDSYSNKLRFDIRFLSERVLKTISWLSQSEELSTLKIGLFGASTGAAAALVAASIIPDIVNAVVSRGGRPDLAISILEEVKAPTLLIVGGDDRQVLDLNKEALAILPTSTEKALEIVKGASHLFEEPGTLEQVAELASNWFCDHLK